MIGKKTAVPIKNSMPYIHRNVQKMDLFLSPIDFERAINFVSFLSYMNKYIRIGSRGKGPKANPNANAESTRLLSYLLSYV